MLDNANLRTLTAAMPANVRRPAQTADGSGTGNTAVFGDTSAVESTDPTWVTSTVPF